MYKGSILKLGLAKKSIQVNLIISEQNSYNLGVSKFEAQQVGVSSHCQIGHKKRVVMVGSID